MKRRIVLAPLLCAVASATHAAVAPEVAPIPDRGQEAVVQALASAASVPEQARNLVKLAWPTGKRDEVVAARARQELANFGDHSMMALREAFNAVKPSYTDEVLVTTLAAQRLSRVEMSGTHMPIVVDAFWIGSHDAKVRALGAIGETHTPAAVQPMIDSAIEDPSLAPAVVEILGAMRFPQARFYLEQMMIEGPARVRPMAASSLAQIGGAALAPLRNALKAPSRDTRLLAARALLPAATEYELGALYEYIEKYGTDDAGVTQALKLSAGNIEKAIAARDAKAAASPKDF